MTLYRKSLTLYQAGDHRLGIAECLEGLAEASSTLSQWENAAQIY